MAIKHAKTATTTNDPSADVGTTDWNAAHTIEAGTVTEAQLDTAAQAKMNNARTPTTHSNTYHSETYLTADDLGTAAALNITVAASAPGSPSSGDIWIDTSA